MLLGPSSAPQDRLEQRVGRLSAIEQGYRLGSFRLFPRQRMLLEGDKPLRLGGRALDTLIALWWNTWETH